MGRQQAEALVREALAQRRTVRHQQGLAPVAETLERAAALDPGYFEASFYLGLTYQDLDDSARAADAYTRALAATPEHLEALARRAACYMEIGRLSDALADAERAVQLAGTSPLGALIEQQLFPGIRLFKAKHDAERAFDADALRRAVPADLPVGTAVQLADLPGVALVLDADHLEHVYFVRGRMCEQEGDAAAAMGSYTTAALLNPRFTPAYFARFDLFNRVMRFKEMLADMNAVLAYAPDNLEAYARRGVAHQVGGDPAASEADFARLLGADLTHAAPMLRYLRGRLLYQRRQFADVLPDVDAVLAAAPQGESAGQAHLLRGQARMALGQMDAAVEDFERAVHLLPDDLQVCAALAEAAKAAQRYDVAIRAWETYIGRGAGGPIPAHVARRFIEDLRGRLAQ